VGIVLAAGFAAVGCGEDESGTGRDTAATATPRPVATNDPRTQKIREVANRYLSATAGRDWTAVCATLVPSERRHFERLAGTCEEAFRTGAVEAGNREVRRLRDARAGEIRIGRHQAVIEINELGWREPLMHLYAIREDGGWGIARSKKLRDS
jgi:hypothetical protein